MRLFPSPPCRAAEWQDGGVEFYDQDVEEPGEAHEHYRQDINDRVTSTYTHRHAKGLVPHGHHGSRYGNGEDRRR